MDLSDKVYRRRKAIVLAAILIVAAVLRLHNNNWDDSNHVHPDERWITMVATDISWPDDLGQALKPQATTLNPFYNANRGEPRNFAYGHFPLYLVRFLASIVSKVASVGADLTKDSDRARDLARWANATDYGHINLVGRVISGVADTITVFFVFLLGRRLYDERVGLLAAALAAFTVLNIQLSHFYAFDVIMVTFILAAIYFDVEVVLRGDTRSAVLAGACTAMAVACKFTASPLLLPLAVAHGLRLFVPRVSESASQRVSESASQRVSESASQRVSESTSQRVSESTSQRSPLVDSSTVISLIPHLTWDATRFNQVLRLFIISLITTAVVFFIASPFAILDIKHYVGSITEQNRMVRGAVDFPYTRQYRHTPIYLYHIQQQLLWGMGFPLGITAYVGFAVLIWRALRRRVSIAEWVLLAWAVPYFAITGSFMVKFMRYMLLLTPFFAIMSAHLLYQLKDRLQARSEKQDIAITHHAPPITHHAPRTTHHAPRTTHYALRIAHRAWPILVAFILISTIFWALAFMQIYTHRLTRVEASDWIYRNIPQGAVTTWEGWDDPLPFNMSLDDQWRSRREYNQVRMDLYEPDGRAKLQHIKDTLRQVDYVIISSKRLWGWLPHMPDRYPVNNRYYELLFDERLGFRLVKTFTSYPRLAGLVFNDDGADESFTVYDHPKVLIFQKQRDLSDAEFQDFFGDAVEAGEAWNRQPATARVVKEEPKKTLLLDEPVDELPVVADLGWNHLANAHPVLSIVMWWLVVEILGLITLPITFALFRNFVDHGYILAKTLGILAVAYVIWILASFRLLPNSLLTAVLALVLVSLFSGLVLRRHRQDVWTFWQDHRRLILINEGIFTIAFLLFVGIRMLNPDLWQPWLGGEKSMEFAFLNASYRTPYFPPYDPYYAGGYLNYYYYGMFLVATLIRLSGIVPSVAFNLAIPLLFALTVSNAFCVVYNLTADKGTRPNEFGTGTEGTEGTTSVASPSSRSSSSSISSLGYPLLAAVFVALIGNLDGMLQVVDGLGEIGGSGFKSSIPGLEPAVRALPGLWRMIFDEGRLSSFDYWRSTRVIPSTINEFPFFSFLFADLHPHMMGIPFTVFVLAVILNMVLDARRVGGEGWWPARGLSYLIVNAPLLLSPWNVLSTLILALSIGAVAVINTWDLPTYLGLAFCAVLVQQYLVNLRLRQTRLTSQRVNESTSQRVTELTSERVDEVTGQRANEVTSQEGSEAAKQQDDRSLRNSSLVTSSTHYPLTRYSLPAVPLLSTAITFVPVAILSLLLYWPFFAHYQAISVGIGLVRMRTEMGNLLTIWGFLLFVVVSLLAAGLVYRDRNGLLRFLRLIALRWERLPHLLDLHRALVKEPGPVYFLGRYALLLVILVAIALVIKGMAPVALLLLIFVLSALLFLRLDATPEEHFINLMAFTGLAVLLGVEVVFLRDFLQGGDHYRMNTVFKFYIQVWVLLGLTAGAGLPRILATLRDHPTARPSDRLESLASDPSTGSGQRLSPASPARTGTDQSEETRAGTVGDRPEQGEDHSESLAPDPSTGSGQRLSPASPARTGTDQSEETRAGTVGDRPEHEEVLAGTVGDRPEQGEDHSESLAPDPSTGSGQRLSPASPERASVRQGAGLRPVLSRAEGSSTSGLREGFGLRWAWLAIFITLLFGSVIYTVLGTAARVDNRFPGARPAIGTLDGMAYMTVGSYTWPDPDNRIELRYDYDAIQWLLRNVKGTPVVAEGRIDYYREGGMRVASYTGLPTLLGAHQNEQRYDRQVSQRDGLAREFYNTANPERALQLIRELNISYIYVGQLERTAYSPEGIQKFEQMRERRWLDLVYENERVKIYKVAG